MNDRNVKDSDIYNNLSEPVIHEHSSKKKFTLYLVLCCISACMGSVQFGFNIASPNLPTKHIIDFYDKCNGETLNVTLNGTNSQEQEGSSFSKNVLIPLSFGLFVVGGMIGALCSKYVADSLGRKKGILIHHFFGIIAGLFVLFAPYLGLISFTMMSRFFFGVQGGMSCGLIPTYLNEISPASIRGKTGVFHQFGITGGILIAQIMGVKQLLGTASLWNYLLAAPMIPATIGLFTLMLFFPESPRALLIKNKDEVAAKDALEKLRNTSNVSRELEQIRKEAADLYSNEAISITALFTTAELRWPIITSIALQIIQQLCGINAVFFYSGIIFKSAGVSDANIQYAVVLTGTINVLATFICISLIEKLGRKPLLVYPMLVMIVDFILLTFFLQFKDLSPVFPYLSIICIIIFIICFAIGLGPIPFIYVAECFRQDARSSAFAICMCINWFSNLVIAFLFPYFYELCGAYVFVTFTIFVGAALILIVFKVPETKSRNVEEIICELNNRPYKVDQSHFQLMNSNA